MSYTDDEKDVSYNSLNKTYTSLDQAEKSTDIVVKEETMPAEVKKHKVIKVKTFRNKVNTKNKFIQFIYRFRKFVIIGAFLLFILITIPTAYIVEFNKTKVTPFSGSSYKSLSSASKIDDFDYDFYCTYYAEPTDEEESHDLTFSATASNFIEGYTIQSLKMTVAIGNSHWTNNYLAGSSKTIKASATSSSSAATVTYTLSNYEYSYPKTEWLFVKVKHPTVWVLLEYKKTKDGNSTSYSYLLTYSYSKWFKNGKTVIE